MILKFKNEKDGWIIYDKIDRITSSRVSFSDIKKFSEKHKAQDYGEFFIMPWSYTYGNEKRKKECQNSKYREGSGIFITGVKKNIGFSCIIRTTCYLCNDEGKTIERLNN